MLEQNNRLNEDSSSWGGLDRTKLDDLWNLLPTTSEINNQKREKLPSAAIMASARACIMAWWEVAYSDELLQKQFITEAESALPLVGESAKVSGEVVYEAMLLQRARLRNDQQLAEWSRD